VEVVPIKGIKVHSEDFTCVNDFLRAIKLLPDPRGKGRKPDKDAEMIYKYLMKEARALKKQKKLTIAILRKRLEVKVKEFFKSCPAKQKKYFYSSQHIRRIVKPIIKK
jgi:hypothetical protein